MIVVDTNVIAYLFLAAESTGLAETLLHREPEWAAPLLWRCELRNVLVVQVHAENLAGADARRIQAEAEHLMSGREYSVSSADVLTLAEASGCSAYDCEFVALAEELDVPLVTVDRQVLAAFPDRALSLQAMAGD